MESVAQSTSQAAFKVSKGEEKKKQNNQYDVNQQQLKLKAVTSCI